MKIMQPLAVAALLGAASIASASTVVVMSFDPPLLRQDGSTIQPGEIWKYNVYRTSTSGVYTDPPLAAVGVPSIQQAIFSNYYFRVKAVDIWGHEGLPSNEVFVYPGMTVTNPLPSPPAATGNITVTVTQ